MKIFAAAKTCLWHKTLFFTLIVILYSFTAAAEESPLLSLGQFRLDCGEYEVGGVLSNDPEKNLSILHSAPGTNSDAELLLLGLSYDQKLSLTGGAIRAKIYVPQPTANSLAPWVFVKKVQYISTQSKVHLPKLISKRACGKKR